ncbi:hypothetical protein B0H67DRAFT_69942 [Lasiosphaeris hirsuta]|uniref:F-box domain-containing protein n=1 Tax=Lasiosphaeris hirsuta TaxID=260670 RepID=A0AA40BBR9_9PEZI|nr:hypothetical protein B0H67DRAFT_69942 [Lasiosphaeris hirsuta]
MTEVTRYPNPHHLGGLSHRPLAPAPAPRSHFFPPDALSDISFLPSANNTYSDPPRPSLRARFMSVLSSTSSASSNTANPRTLSPVSIGTVTMSRDHHQQPLRRPPYASQAQSSALQHKPSQYLQAQVAPQHPLYAQAPASRTYTQPQFSSQMGSIQHQHPRMSFQTYPFAFHPYGSPYHSSADSMPLYQHQTSLLQMCQQYRPPRPSVFGDLPIEIICAITDRLDYLDVLRLMAVNRRTRAQVDIDRVPEEKKIAAVLQVEQCNKRYFPSKSGSSPNYFGCYHCFMIKPPSEFELFRYNASEETEDLDTDTSTPRQRPAALPTSKPHYDPSITRASIVASARGVGSNTPSQNSPRIKELWNVRRFCIQCGIKKRYYKPGDLIELRSAKLGKNGKEGKEPREAVWVCNCWKLNKRPAVIKCLDCELFTPFSNQQSRRRT